MALHINFVSPPSSGKSTLSSELFSKMKKLGYKVELVTEVAKDYVYKKDFVSLAFCLSVAKLGALLTRK